MTMLPTAGWRIAIFLLWLTGGAILLAGLGTPAVSRTQEARVLETSRQMLAADWRGWLIPHLNGQPRLNKPPLAYWTTAAAYLIGGVSEMTGRIPAVLAGWVTLGITFALTRRLFDQQIALVSSAALLGSYLFFRHMRLAETDALATLWITLAIYAIWRSAEYNHSRWLHLAAAATALAVLSKGAPAVFIVIFFTAFCWIERRWDLPKLLATSGALLTFAIIAVPWFACVGISPFLQELKNTASGGDHFGWPWEYILPLLLAAMPWSGFLPVAIYAATRRWQISIGDRFILMWLLAILVPLCLNGNKQSHYLLMLSPPMMILIGRLLLSPPQELLNLTEVIFSATIAAVATAAFMVPWYAHQKLGHAESLDFFTMFAVIAVAAVAISIAKRHGLTRGIFFMLAASPLLLLWLLSIWLPHASPVTSRTIASRIQQQFGQRRYVFWGPNVSLPLCFNLRTAIPTVQNAEQLKKLCSPGTIAIALTKDSVAAPPLPPAFAHRLRIQDADRIFDLYEFEPQ